MNKKKEKVTYQSRLLQFVSPAMALAGILNLILAINTLTDLPAKTKTSVKSAVFILLIGAIAEFGTGFFGLIAYRKKRFSWICTGLSGIVILLFIFGSALSVSKGSNSFIQAYFGIIPSVLFLIGANQFSDISAEKNETERRQLFLQSSGAVMILWSFLSIVMYYMCYKNFLKGMVTETDQTAKVAYITMISSSATAFLAGVIGYLCQSIPKRIRRYTVMASCALAVIAIPLCVIGNIMMLPFITISKYMVFLSPAVPAACLFTAIRYLQIGAPAADAPTLRTESAADRVSAWLYLFLAFFIPFILLFFAFKAMGVSPFGTNMILASDEWHQYYPFLADYQDKLKNGGSLLWTWKSGGGTNYLGLMSYYLASPLNFFTVFIPADKLDEFLYFTTCIKIGLAGFFYALFLRITFKRKDASITAFGIMYALCSFLMGYYWNCIWLDTIALLPLVVAGTFALLRDGKFKLYIISLALSVLANYYIGMFVCAFVFFVSLGYCIVEYKGWKNLIFNFLKMAVCSAVSLMMTAALTLPTYYALQYTHSSNNVYPEKFAVNIGSTQDFAGLLEGMGKTVANSVAFTQPTAREGLPNIYCGVFVIFLALLFFFCSKIKLRERIFCGLLQVFFIVSFVVRQLDYIWHGMHFPNMLPHRFSFLYSFVLIYMAFRVFMYIDDIKLVSVFSGIFAFIIYMGIAYTYYDAEVAASASAPNNVVRLTQIFSEVKTEEPINAVLLSTYFGGILAAWILLYTLRHRIPRYILALGVCGIGVYSAATVNKYKDILNASVNQKTEVTSEFHKYLIAVIIILTLVSALLITFKRINPNHQVTKAVLSVTLLILAIVEGLFSVAAGVKINGIQNSLTYIQGGDDTLRSVKKIESMEKDNTDLYRTEVNKYWTLNDNALIGYNGISMFSSAVNKDVTAYMEKLGICGWVESNRYTYQESSPFTNMMLNVKYIISQSTSSAYDVTHNEIVYQSGGTTVQRNKYYLPMGFMVSKNLLQYSVTSADRNPMNNQNTMFFLATGISGDLYEQITCSNTSSENSTSGKGTLTTNDLTSFSYSSTNKADNYNINYTAPRSGVATAYVSCSASSSINIQVNGANKVTYNIKRPFIMMVGSVNQGDTITLQVHPSDSSGGSITAYCAMFNDDLFRKGYDKLSLSTLHATEVTDTRIKGEITAQENGLFYTSIPYTKGWKAYVDGKEVEITPVGKALVAFELEKGTHTIELRFVPEGYIAGIVLSALALLIFIAMIILVLLGDKILTKCKSILKIGGSSDKSTVKTKGSSLPAEICETAADDDEKTLIADDGMTLPAEDSVTEDDKTINVTDEQ